jgi:hypothetical protein
MNNNIFYLATEINIFSRPDEYRPYYVYDVIVCFSTQKDDYAGLSVEVRVIIFDDEVADLSFINDSDFYFPGIVNDIQQIKVKAIASRAAITKYEEEEAPYESENEECEETLSGSVPWELYNKESWE